MNTKILAAIGALALCPAVVHADVSSANIVGFGNFDVPADFSIWAPVFQNIGKETVDLNDITPKLNGVNITGDGKVQIFKILTTGRYDDTYEWVGSKGFWSKDGETPLADNTVFFENGEGFAMNNMVRVNAQGVETYTGRGLAKTVIQMFCSGQVDLVCKNAVPADFSISGNASPVKIDLTEITPKMPDGETTITGDGKVQIFKILTTGRYDDTYEWVGSKGFWSKDGETPLAKDKVTFDPGEGFAMNNMVRVNAQGVEIYTGRGLSKTPIVMAIPSPIK